MQSKINATDTGLISAGDFTPLPTGAALREHWYQQLGKAEREILRVLCKGGGEKMGKVMIAESVGYQASGGGFNNALSRLRTLGLIDGRGEISASPELF